MSFTDSKSKQLSSLASRIAKPQTLKINGRDISIQTGLFINGQFVNARAGGTLSVEDPSTRSEAIQVAEGREEDVDDAVAAARQAFDNGTWSQSNPVYRAQLLNNLADIMEKNAEDLIAIECLDTGKTLKHCQNLDLPGSVGTLRYYAGWADKVLGEASFNIPGTFSYTRREPVGVCGQIIPWNFPMLMFTWKIAPALATGNTVVIKAAETTPLSALKLCEFIKEAGFPDGTVNLVNGYGKTAGQAIASHMEVDKVAFTGSGPTGRNILRASANSNLKKVTLELGGKSPNIIFPDADLASAVEWSAWGINMNYGQTCHGGTRIYVHADVYDEFLKLFTERMKKVKIGGQFENVDQGPQNSKMQYDKILGYIESAKSEGAVVSLGGQASEKSGKGYYIEPTIFTNVTPNMKVMREEVFGPVVCLSKFTDEAEVIKLANDTVYGLAAGIHTKDYERAVRVTNGLKAGTTWVNMYNFVHWSVPFGGYKESGIGRECGQAALENYTEMKSVYFNMGIKAPE